MPMPLPIRWLRPLKRSVVFSNKRVMAEALDYDRRTNYRLEGVASREAKIKLLKMAIAASALLYIGLDSLGVPVETRTPVKALPIVLLLLLARRLGNGLPYGRRIALGLGLSAIGDCSLELESAASFATLPLFTGGLFAFLAGHCCYASAFCINPCDLTTTVVLPPLVYASGLFVGVLLPVLSSDLCAPVGVYCVVIACMMLLALARKPEGHVPFFSWRCAAAGSVLFVASDSLLALNRFVGGLPRAKIAIMASYYAAQALIALSVRGAQSRPLAARVLGSVENLEVAAKGHKHVQ